MGLRVAFAVNIGRVDMGHAQITGRVLNCKDLIAADLAVKIRKGHRADSHPRNLCTRMREITFFHEIILS